jgi:Outer membrane protein beta-barrel domain
MAPSAKEVSMHRAALVIALALAPVVLSAQAPVRLGLAGGVTTARNYEAGWHVQGSAGLALPVPRLGLRADLSYHSVSRGEIWRGAGLSERMTVPSAALGLTLALPRLGPVAPYAVGGPGWYRNDLGGGTEWHFGLHAGAGAAWRLGRAGVFAEARAHRIADGVNTRLIPLSLGLRF